MKHIFTKKCDWCKTDLIMNGKEADTYVVNAKHKLFCKIHTPGKEPEKDCMNEYIKDKRKKPQIIAKPKIEIRKLTDKNTALKKLAELKQFLSKR